MTAIDTTHINTNQRTWFITGASSGIGMAVARLAAERGDRVAAIARYPEALAPLADEFDGRVLVHAADVADQAAVAGAVAATVAAFGRIDIVMNNAGYGVFGAVEEVSDQQARGIFDTNVFGVLNVLRATLPVLRRQRSGLILQGSSYYGLASHAGVGLLAATKHAVEGLSDALAGELEPLGIHVTIVEPGLTATPFLSNLDVGEAVSDYDVTVRAVQASIGALPPEAFDSVDAVAAAILRASDQTTPPRRLPTGLQGLGEMRTALEQRLEQIGATPAVGAADLTHV